MMVNKLNIKELQQEQKYYKIVKVKLILKCQLFNNTLDGI